jgi:polyisoprenoid-binding protein YceI
MSARYRLDPGHSRFTVQAFASGLLSFLGHSPTFAVREFAGEVRFDPATPEGVALDVTVKADSLALLDNVRPADRADIEGRMRREVLETSAYPEVRFRGDQVSAGRVDGNTYRFRLTGALSLHGVTSPHAVDAEVLLYEDGLRLAGECPLRLSDYGIRPVTALGGAIRLRDQLRVSFDLVAGREA